MPVTNKTIKILRRVEKEILAEPKRINMLVGIVDAYKRLQALLQGDAHKEGEYADFIEATKFIPACGVQGCIAGWTVITQKTDTKHNILGQLDNAGFITTTETGEAIWQDVEREAGEILRLDDDEMFTLFRDDVWPEKFRIDKLKPGTLPYAKKVVARIEHFIKTKGRE